MFEPEGEPARLVVNENVEDLYEFPNQRIVTTAGLAHLFFDFGQMYEIRRVGDSWAAYW